MSAEKKYEELVSKSYEIPKAAPLFDILLLRREKKASAVDSQIWGKPPGRLRAQKPAPPSPAAVQPRGAVGPDITGVVTNVRGTLDRYHRLPLQRTNLVNKSICLDALLLQAEKLEGSRDVHDDALAVFLKHVKTRRDFLDKLISYVQFDHRRISNLVEIVRGRQERGKPAETGGKLTVGLHWSKIMEQLDPYHRDSPFGQDVVQSFARWAADDWDDRLMPSQNLVDFFLSDRYTKKRDKGVPYFNELMKVLSRLIFKPSKQKVYAYYVQHGDGSERKFDRWTTKDCKKGALPFVKPFHTTGGQIVADNETIKYGGLARRDEGIDLYGAQIYVMLDDAFYTYKAQGAKHSMGAAGQAVQTAGLIVAKEGRILAIDNKSGHYRPSWKHLRQAVEAIHRKRAFHEDACVGISHGEGCVFLTVKDFRNLAKRNFPLQLTLDAINRGYTHVFRGETFRQIRRLYENLDQDGNRIWSWEKAKEEFLDLLYPTARKHMARLASLRDRNRAWYAVEFRKQSKHWFPGRGKLDTVDKMVAALEKALDNYAALWISFQPKVKDARLAVTALDSALDDLISAVAHWMVHREKRAAKTRSRAVEELANRLLEDKKTIEAVKEWTWDLNSRDISTSLAEWS